MHVPIKDESTMYYDLGQTINVNNLTYAVLDTEKDYIRDAKIPDYLMMVKSWTDANNYW